MKKIKFTKMSGAGNDFVIVEKQIGICHKKLARNACDRTNGIGADGLIVLDSSKTCDYKMRIINSDGTEAEMCGNGARCLAAYIVKNKRPKKNLFSIQTKAGTIMGEANKETAVIRLSDPKNYTQDIPLDISGRNIQVNYIDTGVPHVIVFVHSIGHIDVRGIGRDIRFHRRFEPRGANVNFVEQESASLVNARTYERGVEDETKACGTGSVASALITYLKLNPDILNKKKASMKIRTKSSEILNVLFDIIEGNISNVWLKGSAKFIAEGEYFLK